MEENNNSMNPETTEMGEIAETAETEKAVETGKLEEMKSPEKNQLKIIIPLAIVAVLMCVLIGVAAVAGLFESKKQLLIKAVTNVFAQSTGAIKEVWGLDEYKDMFADGRLSVEADIFIGNGAQISMDISKDEDVSGAEIDVGYYGSSLFQANLYADKEEILLAAPELTDTVFYVDRTNLDEDIEWFIREYDIDRDIADVLESFDEKGQKDIKVYQELGLALGKITGAFLEMYDEMEVEKTGSKNLKVDGEERNCKGYILTISGEQLQSLISVVGEVYESNEVFKLYVDGLLAMSYGYGSQEEFLEDYDPHEVFSDLKDKIGEEQKPAVITFYLYRKNLAGLLVELWDGISVEWNVYGGNFPLENMELTITNGYETSVYSRKGSLESDIYKAEYQTEYDGDEVVFSLEYDTVRGDFDLEVSADYGLYTLIYLMEGEIDRTVPGSELTISIDTFEMNDLELLAGDITFSDEVGEIIKPEGPKQNVMRMTKSDWYAILMEVSGNLY